MTSQARYLADVWSPQTTSAFRGPCRIRPPCRSAGSAPITSLGTDRVAEAASASQAQIIVNVQGNQPMIDPAAINAAILGLTG